MKLYSLAIHRAGWPFIGIFAVATVLLSLIGIVAGFAGLVLTLWCAYFFRDPTRVTPTRVGLVVSPADGKVLKIEEVIPEAELGLGDQPLKRISIFLNVFDVHLNRVPADGTIIATRYRAGKFLHAASDKASIDNERMAIIEELTGDHPFAGKKLGFIQIAGFVARRIVCDIKEGDTVKAGEHYGLIRFGSRADIYLPQGLEPLVIPGQYMIGGETIIADALSSEKPRDGEVR